MQVIIVLKLDINCICKEEVSEEKDIPTIIQRFPAISDAATR